MSVFGRAPRRGGKITTSREGGSAAKVEGQARCAGGNDRFLSAPDASTDHRTQGRWKEQAGEVMAILADGGRAFAN